MKNRILMSFFFTAIVTFMSCEPTSKKSSEKIAKVDQGSIVIYGSNTCQHCIDFKAQLDSVGLAYTFNDVDVNNEQTLIMIDLVKKHEFKGRISFPVVYIKNKNLLIAPKLEEVLKLL